MAPTLPFQRSTLHLTPTLTPSIKPGDYRLRGNDGKKGSNDEEEGGTDGEEGGNDVKRRVHFHSLSSLTLTLPPSSIKPGDYRLRGNDGEEGMAFDLWLMTFDLTFNFLLPVPNQEITACAVMTEKTGF